MTHYRVYYDDDARTTVIEGLSIVFPQGSLDVRYAPNSGGNLFEIVSRADRWTVLGPIGPDRIKRRDGTGFASGSECYDYLRVELAKKDTSADPHWAAEPEW